MPNLMSGPFRLFLLLFILLLFIAGLQAPAQAQNDYYFPGETAFDSSIPTPEEFLGYPVGSHYTRHDRIVDYFNELARLSDKARIRVIGESYQHRPQVVLIITSPENHSRIEEIRSNHLTLTDPDAPMPDIEASKTIISLAYSVHGNETSSGEAALLTAYYMVASGNPETARFLDETVILMDPAQNPDGRDRAANWHNSYKSFPPVSDPVDIEHREGWPAGRGNHFLHDLNRDWFPVTQQESANRVRFYQTWYPNIQIDFHEMGTNSTYYLEPTQPKRTWNPIIPEYHYEVMNPLLAEYQAGALDRLGELYWTKEVFDNISPIYGSTYPDILGGVGVTFEVGSSRGLVQENDAGQVTFRSTIRRHVATGIATVRAGVEEKQTILEYQKDFFESAIEQADARPVKAYIFGDPDDLTLTYKFLNLLLTHNIEVYKPGAGITMQGESFSAEESYLVPAAQPNYRLIHDIFETRTEFADSVFYDITAWSLVHGYGIRHGKITSENYERSLGERVTSVPEREGKVHGGKSSYAYLMSWKDYKAPAALYRLLDQGVVVRSAHRPFTAPTEAGPVEFGYGSLIISVAEQDLAEDEVFERIQSVAEETGLAFYATSTGFNLSGIDLGSRNAVVVEKPEAAIVFGDGVRSTDAGEAWFLLNKHMGLELTKINSTDFGRADLDRYNTLILVDGNYNSWNEDTIANLKEWVRDGGTLITTGNASSWVVNREIVSEKLLEADGEAESKEETAITRFNYEEREDRLRADGIPGIILEADIDTSNPVAFGLDGRRQLIMKRNSHRFKASSNPYATVAFYTENPLVGGFVKDENLEKIKNTAAILVAEEGSGNVILFSETPTFRSYWHTTSRLFMNAILFGRDVNI